MDSDCSVKYCRRGALRRITAWTWLLVAASLGSATISAGPLPTPQFDRQILFGSRLGPVPAGFVTWSELFTEQQRLNAAARDLESDPAAASQLGGIVADPTQRRLQVYWKGELLPGTRARLAQLRRAVRIEISPSAYSRTELRLAAQRLARDARVVNVAPRADGSGIKVRADIDQVAGDSRQLLRALQVAALGEHSRVPLSFSLERRPMQVSTRDAVTSPAFAGTRVWDAEGRQGCSLGFAVTRRATYSKGWLFAAHCTLPTNRYSDFLTTDPKKNDEPGSFAVGAIQWFDTSPDLAFIAAHSNVTAGPFVYVGKSYGEDAAVPVGDWGRSYVGNYVFASGAATGLNGALHVEETDVTSPGGLKGLVFAVHTQGGVGAAGGDSGGPVFAFMPDGRAEARGVLLLNEGKPKQIACAPNSRAKYRAQLCTPGVYYADIDEVEEPFIVLKGDWP